LAFEAAAQRSRSGAAIASLIALPLALRVCTSGRFLKARTHQRLLLEQDRDGNGVLGQRAPGDVDQLLLRSRLAVLQHDDGTARSVRRARRHAPDAFAHRSIRQRDRHAVVHSGVRVERVLDLAAGHVLALDDDDLRASARASATCTYLLRPRLEVEEALAVEAANVASAEPAAGQERFSRRLLVADVCAVSLGPSGRAHSRARYWGRGPRPRRSRRSAGLCRCPDRRCAGR